MRLIETSVARAHVSSRTLEQGEIKLTEAAGARKQIRTALFSGPIVSIFNQFDAAVTLGYDSGLILFHVFLSRSHDVGAPPSLHAAIETIPKLCFV